MAKKRFALKKLLMMGLLQIQLEVLYPLEIGVELFLENISGRELLKF